MLVLSRKSNQSIVIAGGIRVTVLGHRGDYVRLGIEAPSSVKVLREELCEADAHAANFAAPPRAAELLVEAVGPAA